ncbi:MAG: GNAT family N-acetyltransferase [Cyanothece sp. SIO1E1]|nr:GNAT family N-acetyltransferase [Cyanothece sp. SIO1E1]
MAAVISKNENLVIRPVQYRDLDALKQLFAEELASDNRGMLADGTKQLERMQSWYGAMHFLQWMPSPLFDLPYIYVAENQQQLCGMIQVSPCNRTRSTWRVDRVCVNTAAGDATKPKFFSDIGSQLLRYCFEAVWEARTWLIEVNINHKDTLALYRHNGFQTLGQMTYWAIAPEHLKELSTPTPALPNLLPVSNADAQLLYQLNTVSMPPLVRQVFDYQIQDFQSSLFRSMVEGAKQWLNKTDKVSGYVFEPQRKAAIGYFAIQLCRHGTKPHGAQLIVHPAYTWLYPELLCQMAQITQNLPEQSLQLASADYQPEREEYLTQVGAHRIEHTLMMSRSVWHKLRESRLSFEALQLPEMLQGLQPQRKPVPGRMSWMLNSIKQTSTSDVNANETPSQRCQSADIHPTQSS